MSTSKRVEKVFVDKFGNSFNPGDSVIIMTKSTGTTDITRGVYLGVITTNRRVYSNYNTNKTRSYDRVQVKKIQPKWDHTKGEYIQQEYIATLWRNNILPENATVDDICKVVY